MRLRKFSLLALSMLHISATSPNLPMIDCFVGPYIVFFEHDLAFIDREAREILDNVVENAGQCGSPKAMLAGHSDTSEPSALARKRVDVVREYLAAHGMPRSDLKTATFGSTALRVKTAKGVPERRNRRVEIIYYPVP